MPLLILTLLILFFGKCYDYKCIDSMKYLLLLYGFGCIKDMGAVLTCCVGGLENIPEASQLLFGLPHWAVQVKIYLFYVHF